MPTRIIRCFVDYVQLLKITFLNNTFVIILTCISLNVDQKQNSVHNT